MVKLWELVPSQEFVLASSEILGQVSGSLVGGYCGGRYGPRRTIMASCLCGALGWVTITLSPYILTSVLGRVLCGMASSFTTANCSMLVAQYRYSIV